MRAGRASLAGRPVLVAFISGRDPPAWMKAIILRDQRVVAEAALDRLDALLEMAAHQEQRAIGLPQSVNVGARIAAPAHADDIEPVEIAALADREAERNDVGADDR